MYIPLRVHGHHSLLTGVDSPAALLQRARELGLSALALTDVDTVSGLVDFLRAAEKQRAEDPRTAVRAIVGAEISELQGAEAHGPHAQTGQGRAVLLVASQRGYGNLCRVITARHLGPGLGREGALIGDDDRERSARSFRRVDALVRWHEGLFILVDHPGLVAPAGGSASSGPKSELLAGRPRRQRGANPLTERVARARRDDRWIHPSDRFRIPPPARSRVSKGISPRVFPQRGAHRSAGPLSSQGQSAVP